MGDRNGQGWGPIWEARITQNCAEGGKSAPQAWLVVPGVGGWVGEEGSVLGVLLAP